MVCNLAPHLGLRVGADRAAAEPDVQASRLMAPRERVRRALRRHGALTMEGIAEATGLDIDAVRPVVYEMRREEQIVREQTFSLVREPAR